MGGRQPRIQFGALLGDDNRRASRETPTKGCRSRALHVTRRNGWLWEWVGFAGFGGCVSSDGVLGGLRVRREGGTGWCLMAPRSNLAVQPLRRAFGARQASRGGTGEARSAAPGAGADSEQHATARPAGRWRGLQMAARRPMPALPGGLGWTGPRYRRRAWPRRGGQSRW